jgi:hypothetical protein
MGGERLPSRHLRRTAGAGVFALLMCLCFLSSTARAGVSSLYMGRNDSWSQTGNGSMLSPIGSFFSMDLFSDNPNEFDTVQMTYPGLGSPVFLLQVGPTVFHYQTPYLANQAAMDAAYPMGTYQFAASLGGGTPTTTSLPYQSDYYPQSLPYLAGTNYHDLQGMNVHLPFTFQFSPFVTGSLPTNSASWIFLTIYDYTKGAFVFNQGFLPSTTTSLVLPANTLTPGDTFGYELIFDNRALNLPTPGTTFGGQISYDYRADGLFTAAVPEPTTAVLLTPAAICLAALRARLRAKKTKAARSGRSR